MNCFYQIFLLIILLFFSSKTEKIRKEIMDKQDFISFNESDLENFIQNPAKNQTKSSQKKNNWMMGNQFEYLLIILHLKILLVTIMYILF